MAFNLRSLIETDLWFNLSEKQFLSEKQSVYWKWSQPPPLYFPPFGPPPFLPQDLRDLSHYHHNLFLPSQALSQILQDLHILFLLSFFYLFQPSLRFYWIYTFLLSPFPALSQFSEFVKSFSLLFQATYQILQNFWNLSRYHHNLYSPYLVVFQINRIWTICLTITRVQFYLSMSFFHHNSSLILLIFNFSIICDLISFKPNFIFSRPLPISPQLSHTL